MNIAQSPKPLRASGCAVIYDPSPAGPVVHSMVHRTPGESPLPRAQCPLSPDLTRNHPGARRHRLPHESLNSPARCSPSLLPLALLMCAPPAGPQTPTQLPTPASHDARVSRERDSDWLWPELVATNAQPHSTARAYAAAHTAARLFIWSLSSLSPRSRSQVAARPQ
jgi:hypothetical protein